MKHSVLFFTLALSCFFSCTEKNKYPLGYPSADGEIDIRKYFANPPKGYGNVPFYWWNGDTLVKERLKEQLDLLADSPTDGFAVSYIHTHPRVDVELNAQGYGSFGRADGGAPEVFSNDWWEVWNWFSSQCAKRDMGVGLDDYVVGWAGNGYYVDELLKDSAFANYQGRLHADVHEARLGDTLKLELPNTLVALTSYPQGQDLMPWVKEGALHWTPTEGDTKVYAISTRPAYELHPEYGARLIDVYFNRFEERMDEQGRRGMNFFFQDELHYNLNIHSWSEDMAEEFEARKGYDIRPHLISLFTDMDSLTPKYRLDYAEVVTQLSEERYFKPIYEWHAKRNQIYGCDNNGRGLHPVEYLDYFRSISWFTAPGNDAPARGSSFRQTKVSSSVAHLYERPRTWLEAFHSMGWDSNGEWLTSQLDHHLIAGGNLLCLHGLYYSTHGGWWEWAPPCFHFRMPYWPHLKQWLRYAQRMCFVLSQGRHVCDVAVLYPTETLQAYPNARIDRMWRLTDLLSEHGTDYDFIDFHSLQKAKITDGRLSIAGENYRILVLTDVKAMHKETWEKVAEFARQGGMVVATDMITATTDGTLSAQELQEQFIQMMKTGSCLMENDVAKAADYILQREAPDFRSSVGKGRVLHRRIGERDVYMVMDVERGSELTFRAHGQVEVWDAMNGKIKPYPVLEQAEGGTCLRHDAERGESRLYVFSPGRPDIASEKTHRTEFTDTVMLDGDWEVEIIPTMNNRWGDYRLPASDELIGVEAREVAYFNIDDSMEKLSTLSFDKAPRAIYGYAPHMLTQTLSSDIDLNNYLQRQNFTGYEKGWKPYEYSWQYGVKDNPGSQGYHGLKGKVDDRFLILDQGGHQLFFTHVYAPYNGQYRMVREGVKPTYTYMDGVRREETDTLTLTQGWHTLLLAYADTRKQAFILEHHKSNNVDNRHRSAFLLYDVAAPMPEEVSPYGKIVAMKWYNTSHLLYQADTASTYAYHFPTAPAMENMKLVVHGRINHLWANGDELSPSKVEEKGEVTYYEYTPERPLDTVGEVRFLATPRIGYSGAAFFAEPVKLTCGKGRMPVGDWSHWGAMKFFSGGVRYTKVVTSDKLRVTNDELQATSKYMLDLGIVDATCEVVVNGQSAGILLSFPYQTDITPLLHEETNRIEVLVYSSLANHYQTIPSAYRGTPRAGLLGPVRIIINQP